MGDTSTKISILIYLKYSILRHRVLFLKNRIFDSCDHVILFFEVTSIISNNGEIKPKIIIFRNYSVGFDIFVANKYDN